MRVKEAKAQAKAKAKARAKLTSQPASANVAVRRPAGTTPTMAIAEMVLIARKLTMMRPTVNTWNGNWPILLRRMCDISLALTRATAMAMMAMMMAMAAGEPASS